MFRCNYKMQLCKLWILESTLHKYFQIVFNTLMNRWPIKLRVKKRYQFKSHDVHADFKTSRLSWLIGVCPLFRIILYIACQQNVWTMVLGSPVRFELTTSYSPSERSDHWATGIPQRKCLYSISSVFLHCWCVLRWIMSPHDCVWLLV